MKQRTYKDAFPDIRRGIFDYIMVPPWDDYAGYLENDPLPPHYRVAKETLNQMMFVDYGERLQGSVLQSYDVGNGVDMVGAGTIANMIMARYAISWRHLWNAVSAEYAPIDNYNAIETESTITDGTERENNALTIGEQSVTTNNLSDVTGRSRDMKDTRTETSSESGQGARKTGVTEGEKVFGFDSKKSADRAVQNQTGAESSDTNAMTSAQSVTGYTGNESENVSHTGTISAQKNGTSGNVGHKETDLTVTRTLTRRGNIGVTTSAQMIQGEIALWEWSYYRRVLEDVANYLTLSVWA